MKLEGTQTPSFTDVVAYSVDPVFDKKEIVIAALSADVAAGDVINDLGALYSSTDTTDPRVVLVSAKAAVNAHVIVADRGAVLKRTALKAADAAGLIAAIKAIETAGINRLTVN